MNDGFLWGLSAAGIAILLVFLPATGEGPAAPALAFRVVGYLPEYRVAAIDLGVGKYLTDLVFFSVEPGADGGIDRRRPEPEHLARLRKIKEQGRVSLVLCVGGWERSKEFAKVAASEESRTKFARALAKFCVDNHFDGADLDWEHPATEAQEQDYAALLVAAKKALAAHELSLSVALAGWQRLPAEGMKAVDRVHLMAYDAKGRHSTLAFAEAEVARAVKNGAPRGKICLGLPFYGRAIADGAKAQSYAEIVARHRPGPETDEVDGYYFNGLRTIERKVRFARKEGLAGVMAWELGQDTQDDRSLLRAAWRAATDKGQ